jgi:hypothetical protein
MHKAPDLRARRRALTLFVLAAASSRLLPHPPNFTAVPAMALFSGALFGRGWLAFAVPMLAMALSDLVLGIVVYGIAALTGVVPVYLCIGAMVWIGFRTVRSIRGIALGAVASTATFFLITNLSVWAFGGLYPRTPAGLAACYVAAIPFTINMLASCLLYGFGMFGLWTLAERRFPALAQAR